VKKPRITTVTPENILDTGLYCLGNTRAPGFERKRRWFAKRCEEGLRLKILEDEEGRQLGFIEYIPAEKAWRPVDAPGYLFIHCMFVSRKPNKGRGHGSRLIGECLREARAKDRNGVAVMTSDGAWVTGKDIFLRHGFEEAARRGRFELRVRQTRASAPDARLVDWEAKQARYKGWHLVYADQCPYHQKAADALREKAEEHGIELSVRRLTTAKQAQAAPSGFGVFSLLRDGTLLEDHYISATRFENILRQQLGRRRKR
jgi:GNAT superfamily N-acetyltransferase